MGLEDLPEVKLARRIIAKHSLATPFDLGALVKEYAELFYMDIPIKGVDGVSINLKVPGKTPTVIVNSSLPSTRQLFTLAHELGHIIIPWHVGTIVDEIYTESFKDYAYAELEQEANRFAAELLMPKSWITHEFKNTKSGLAKLQWKIVNQIGVSDQAAAIRLIQILPRDIIFIAVEDGLVINSGKTLGTNAFVPELGTIYSKEFYPYTDSHTIHYGVAAYHWFIISNKIELDLIEDEDWRSILDEIVLDIQPGVGSVKYKHSINGIVAAANSNAKREDNYNLNSLITSCIHRLRRPGLEDFVAHHKFKKFVMTRARAFF